MQVLCQSVGNDRALIEARTHLRVPASDLTNDCVPHTALLHHDLFLQLVCMHAYLCIWILFRT